MPSTCSLSFFISRCYSTHVSHHCHHHGRIWDFTSEILSHETWDNEGVDCAVDVNLLRLMLVRQFLLRERICIYNDFSIHQSSQSKIFFKMFRNPLGLVVDEQILDSTIFFLYFQGKRKTSDNFQSQNDKKKRKH